MAATDTVSGTTPQAGPSRLKKAWKSISIVFESRIATVGLAIVVFWVLVGLISLVWTPFPPNASLFEQNLTPNSTNILGTDNLGRDTLSRLMTGTQVILLKTRVPETTLNSYFIAFAALAILFSLSGLIPVLINWSEDRRRAKLFGLLAILVIGSFGGLFLLPEDAPGWIPFAITFGAIYVFFFFYGWVRRREWKMGNGMRNWTIALVIAIFLAAIALIPALQTALIPTFSLPIGVAIWGVLGSLAAGSFLGLNAGYRSGWWDQSIMQGLDALIAFPVIVLYLVVIASLGQGDLVVILAIAVTGAPGVARLVRGLTLDIKTRDYIRAAETRGESVNYIMFREILPNARGPILVDAMLRVGYAIFAIGTLGFLGIGLPPPDPDWGNMVNDARQFIFVNPLGVVWPALAIASLVIGLNFFADGMREEITRFQK